MKLLLPSFHKYIKRAYVKFLLLNLRYLYSGSSLALISDRSLFQLSTVCDSILTGTVLSIYGYHKFAGFACTLFCFSKLWQHFKAMRFNRRFIFFLFLITIVTLCWYLFVKNSVNLSLEALTVAPFNETVSGTKPWSLVDREVIATPPLQRRKRKYSTEKLMHLDRTRPSERSKDAWLEPMMLYKDAEEKFQEGPACLIPKINPFHELAMKELHDVGVIDCPKEDFGHVVNGSLILMAEGLRYAHIQYIQRPAVIDNVDDNYDDEYLLSDPFHLIEPNRGIIQPGNSLPLGILRIPFYLKHRRQNT